MLSLVYPTVDCRCKRTLHGSGSHLHFPPTVSQVVYVWSSVACDVFKQPWKADERRASSCKSPWSMDSRAQQIPSSKSIQLFYNTPNPLYLDPHLHYGCGFDNTKKHVQVGASDLAPYQPGIQTPRIPASIPLNPNISTTLPRIQCINERFRSIYMSQRKKVNTEVRSAKPNEGYGTSKTLPSFMA